MRLRHAWSALRLTLLAKGEASNYRRELNLDTAIATTTFKIGAATYVREVFASGV